jgi:hypothetical protein
MQQFIRKRQADVMGVLSGFDRIRFRGTLRWLATVPGLRRFLWAVQVKWKDFTAYSQGITHELRETVERTAEEAGRPVVYLNSTAVSKEDHHRLYRGSQSRLPKTQRTRSVKKIFAPCKEIERLHR